MKKRISMRVLILALLLICNALASVPISLDEAIAKTKANNSEISIARYSEEIKALEHKSAKGLSYGSLDISHNAVRSNDALSVFGFKLQSRDASFADFGFNKQFDGNSFDTVPEDLNHPKARNHFQTKIEYTLPLYTGGKIEQYEKITKALEQMSGLEKEQLIATKIYEVKKSFSSISLLEGYLKTLSQISSNISRLESMAEALMQEGYVKKVDLLEVQSKKANIERAIGQTSANRELLYHYLAFLIGEKVDAISGNYEDALPLNQSESELLSSSIDIEKAKQGVAISQMSVGLAQSAFLPQIGAFAQYGSSNDEFMKDFSKNDAYTVGIGIKLNLFNGGSDSANLQKARIESLKANEQFALAQKQIALAVRQIFTQIKNFDYEIKSLETEVELAGQIYQNYALRYEQKLSSINDVLMKHSEQLNKILRLNEVKNARNEKIYELQKISYKDRP